MTKTLIIAGAALFAATFACSAGAQEMRQAKADEASPAVDAVTAAVSEPAAAPQSAEPETGSPAAAPLSEAVAAPAAEPTFAGRVLQAIEAGAGGAATAAEADREVLRAYYGQPDAKSIWVGEQGPNDLARAVAAELGRAGDFGLDAADYRLPALGDREATDAAMIELAFGLAVLKYARHAKGGRVDPASVRHQLNRPAVADPADVLAAARSSGDAALYLRSLHPQHPQFAALRDKLAALKAAKDQRSQTALPDGPVLRRAESHAQVALLRKRLAVAAPASAADAAMFDEDVETAVRAFQRQKGLSADGIVGPGTRSALNGETDQTLILKLLVNMERWRWLPDDIASGAGIYVWANIPEFRVRVVKAGKVVFDERAIMGKVDKQTPVFSDQMEWIEFHPTWFVPNSIKVEDILPSLRRPTSRIMERYHLSLDCGRHGRDPAAIDWNSVDIRTCSVTQPAGDKSVLGDFKFKFPNEHDVYMHDTQTVRLFNADTRTFSHGCIRVRNPRRLAEILLGNDKGMTPAQIGAILDGPRRVHQEDFVKPVPVHITYFTTFVDDDGALKTRPDYYGHDRRLAEALTGQGERLSVPYAAKERVSPRDATSAPREAHDWRRRALMMQN